MATATEERIVGYERVPDGNACSLCNTAAGQRYRSSDLLPIHGGCGCGVRPVLETELLKPKIGDRVEFRSGQELVGNEWVPAPGIVRGKVVKRQKNNMILINAGTESRPRWVAGSRLDARKPTRAATKPTGPKAIDVDALETIEPQLKGQAIRDRLNQPKEMFPLEERKAIQAYTGSLKTDVAEQLNRSLRNQTFGPRSQWKEVADKLDEAFNRVEALDEPALVFRGAKVKFQSKLRVGSVVEDFGYVSTSPSRSVAEKFVGFDSDLFEIVLPKGTKALDINEAAGSAYGSERELLLPRGTKFVIESIRENPKHPGQRIIRARVIL